MNKKKTLWLVLAKNIHFRRYCDSVTRSFVSSYSRITRLLFGLEELNQRFARGSPPLAFLVYLTTRFAMVGLVTTRFLIGAPMHVVFGPRRSFERLAPRDAKGTYQSSYTRHLKEHWASAALTTLIIAAAALRVISVVIVSELIAPTRPVAAVSTSATLNPNWDRTSDRTETVEAAPDCSLSVTFSCESATATALKTGVTQTDVGCAPDFTLDTYRGAMKFSLSTIPDNATITDVSLTLNVSTTTTATITILRTAVDDISASSCTSSTSTGMYTRMGTGTTYVTTSNWNTTGSKTYDLGTTADSDVQTRLTGSDIVTIATTTGSQTTGQYSSVDASSNKPQLVVSYTTPPETPTNFGHASNTTTAVTWSWTDNATADTSNVIHDAGHAVQCTTGAVSGTGATGTCAESSLSANTQYTRHANAIDNQGNTDSTAASAYTSIETPAGVTFSNVTTSGLTVVAAGTLSNLASASSGVYCQESVTSTNSGWLQTNAWTKSSLTANTQYTFQCQARNGDGDETPLTTAASKYTLAVSPNVTASRSTSTWYSTPSFSFTNGADWGTGGVQHYRYLFDESATHTFDNAESTWSDANAKCPSGACTVASTALVQTATMTGSDWYLHVQSFNGDNVAGSIQDLGPYWFDGTAPTISQIKAAATQTSLTITWNTNEEATTQVEYGATTNYGTLTTLNAALDLSHSVTIAGLTAGTTYHFRARSKDAAGTEALSSDNQKATTSPTAAAVSGLQAGTITTTGATIMWTTSLAATSVIAYGTTSAYGSTASASGTRTSHAVALSALTPSTLYHYRVNATDANNQSVTSPDQTFTTLALTTITGVTVTHNSATSVTVSWTTNHPADSKVRYGATTDYGLEAFDATLVASHALSLNDLAPGTLYHYEVLSQGNSTVIDADATFTTASATPVVTLSTPTLVSPVAGEIVFERQPKIVGLAKSGVTVSVTIDSQLAGTVPAATTSTGTGSFVYRPKNALGYGQHTVSVSASDGRENQSRPSDPRTFTVGQPVTPPAVATVEVVAGATPKIVVQGTAPRTGTVRILLDGEVIKQLKVDERDAFSAQLSTARQLAAGRHELILQVLDVDGNVVKTTRLLSFHKSRATTQQTVVTTRGTFTYLVVPGDSLWKISQRFLGAGQRYPRLVEANVAVHPTLGKNPNLLLVGWRLKITRS